LSVCSGLLTGELNRLGAAAPGDAEPRPHPTGQPDALATDATRAKRLLQEPLAAIEKREMQVSYDGTIARTSEAGNVLKRLAG